MTLEKPKSTMRITVNDREFLLNEANVDILMKDLGKIYYEASNIFRLIADAISDERQDV